ncbi:hypothetical protein UP17_21415 [Peribacillus simplex]|uniref:hypothetical protein n=1 Tax=Peribacillus simplex TaxID=1478 RepID=UPI0007776E2B|nr:hypothetical protein [Peribacillus simplex]AMM94715.1 hypothetical protein UP17_21415 [Peribacillus simplex]
MYKNGVANIKNFLAIVLFVLIIGASACNKEVVKENGEASERKSVKEENVVKVEEAEKLFKGYYTARYTIKDPANPPTFAKIATMLKNIYQKMNIMPKFLTVIIQSLHW